MTKSRLFLVLKLIGWKDGASATDQSQSKEKENLTTDYFRPSILKIREIRDSGYVI